MAKEPSFQTKRNIKNKDKAVTVLHTKYCGIKMGLSLCSKPLIIVAKMSKQNVRMRKESTQSLTLPLERTNRHCTIVVFDQSHE